jgi:hypothetical protein
MRATMEALRGEYRFGRVNGVDVQINGAGIRRVRGLHFTLAIT